MGRTGRSVNDLTGMRFGNLVVLYRGDKRGKSNGAIHWKCLCDCGEVIQVRGWHLTSGHSSSCGCSRRNSKLTDKERRLNRIKKRSCPGYKEWRTEVFQRDSFTCQKCKGKAGGNLAAHHIEGYANNPELRTELSNGVTLCEDCHKDYHHIHGYNKSSRRKFEKWINN